LNQIHGFFLPFAFPAALSQLVAGPEGANNRAKSPPPDSDPFSDAEFGKNLAGLSNQFAASSNRRFEFEKSRQLFIRVHNKTLSVVPINPASHCKNSRAEPSMRTAKQQQLLVTLRS
jgi:hypothetical protein